MDPAKLHRNAVAILAPLAATLLLLLRPEKYETIR